MGVMGLLSYCLGRKEECIEKVDLVEISRQRGGIEILCDFYSFEHLLIQNFWRSLANVAGNEYLRILGGEYAIQDAYVSKLIHDLKSLDIHLVMFIDGAKGSSKIGTEQKLETWNYRHGNEMKKLRDLMQVCEGGREMKTIPDTTNIRPVLLEVQFIETLKRNQCEIVQCPSGEADYVLAKSLHTRPKAYAVLSNDSDFCIFRDSCFIPNELFDMKNDLQLGKNQPFPDKPIRLECGVISCDRVQKLLGFVDQSQLVELSIIAGNDFTGPFLRRGLHSHIGIKGRGSVTDFTKWVKENRHVDNHPRIVKEMQKNPAFGESVRRSREFYSLAFDPDEAAEQGSELTGFLENMVRQIQVPANVMAMHRHFFWFRMLLEDVSKGAPSIEMILAQLRSYVYRMVLDRKTSNQSVIEHGRSPWRDLQHSVVHSNNVRWLVTVDIINPEKIFQNLRTFTRIMSHMEPEGEVKYFDRYGRKNGFLCFVLRYFLRLNAGYNLHISLSELLTLIATVFAKVDITWYQTLAICPSTRCVTMSSWFQDVYRHAYEYFGKMLHIHHEFPSPAEIFSGAVFTGFYMLDQHHDDLSSAGFLPPWSERILGERHRGIQEQRHMTKQITEGIFNYNPRF